MTEEEYVPFGAEIHVANFERSLKFYRDVLGFRLLRIDELAKFAALEFNEAIFMFEEHKLEPPRGKGTILRFLLPGKLEEYHDTIKASGANISKPIEKTSYGLTRFYVTDPDGYQLKFSIKS